jgi:hypothetical protein
MTSARAFVETGRRNSPPRSKALPLRQRCGHFCFGLGDSQLMGVMGGRWANSMVILSVPVDEQPPGWAENRREFTHCKKSLANFGDLGDSRDCDLTRNPRPLADIQPASQAGCLFVGFDNSVVWLRGADSGPQHEIVPGFFGFVEPEYE